MFSHVAEETTRLAHGFLGALFSVIILWAPQAFWPIAVLCSALYLIFFLTALGLHLTFRIQVDGRPGNLMTLLCVVAIGVLLIACVFFHYFVGSQPQLTVEQDAALRFGLVIFAGFWVSMLISHMMEISTLQKQRDRRRAGEAPVPGGV